MNMQYSVLPLHSFLRGILSFRPKSHAEYLLSHGPIYVSNGLTEACSLQTIGRISNENQQAHTKFRRCPFQQLKVNFAASITQLIV